jgi:hypothetical protein
MLPLPTRPRQGPLRAAGRPAPPDLTATLVRKQSARGPRTTRSTLTTVHGIVTKSAGVGRRACEVQGKEAFSRSHTPHTVLSCVEWPVEGLRSSLIMSGFVLHQVSRALAASSISLVSTSRAAGSSRPLDALCLQCPAGFYSEAAGKIERRIGEGGITLNNG